MGDGGIVWLLGADAAHPVVTRLDPRTMGATEVRLSELLPAFPAAPTAVRVESLHRIVPFSERASRGQNPCSLVGAATPEGPRYWMVRLGSEAPQVLWGPRRLELPTELPWAGAIMAQALPHLRPLQDVTKPWYSPDDFRVISLELGDVTAHLADATTTP